jgi:hypothetical protein
MHTPVIGSTTSPTEQGSVVGTSLGALGVVSGADEEGRVGVTAVVSEVGTGVIGVVGSDDEEGSGGSKGGLGDETGGITTMVMLVGIGEKGKSVVESFGISTVFSFGGVLVVTTVAPTTTAATPRNVSGDRAITLTACPRRSVHWPGPIASRPGRWTESSS